MQKALLIFLIGLLSSYAYGQVPTDVQTIQFVSKDDYRTHERHVIACANYLLSTPLDNDDVNQLHAMQFLLRWMEGTPDYTFVIDGSAGAFIQKNSMILGRYLACMAKYVLENQDKARDTEDVKFNTVKNMLAYCQNPVNKVKLNKDMKKLIEANKNGQLQEYLQKK